MPAHRIILFPVEATANASRPPSRVVVEGEEAEAEPEVPKPRILVLGCGTSTMGEETTAQRCQGGFHKSWFPIENLRIPRQNVDLGSGVSFLL